MNNNENRISSLTNSTLFYVHTNFPPQKFYNPKGEKKKNGFSFEFFATWTLVQVAMAATPSAVPQNLSSHHSQSHFSFANCVNLKQSHHRIHPRSTLVAPNGVSATHKSYSFKKLSKPITVLGHNSKFLQMGSQETQKLSVKSMASDSGSTSATLSKRVFEIAHLVVSLGIILVVEKLLKKAFVAAAIKFPSALFGMFCIFSILMILDSTIPDAATSLMSFFEPALLFIQRWLPLFYVPSLVILPLSVRDIPAASGLKICYIICKWWFPFRWEV